MKKSFPTVLIVTFLLTPLLALATTSPTVDDEYVEITTKQGGEWFTAFKGKTDSNGSLRIKGVLPGKYVFNVDEDDMEPGQKLEVELRMKDEDGKNFREKSKFEAYIYIGDTKVFINTFKTDKSGYLKLKGLTPGMTYELKAKDSGKVKSKDGLARIKTKAKIDDSDWFASSYDRLEADTSGLTNGILEIKSALPGKYKFKLKSDDPFDPAKPFMVKARMRKDSGKKIKEPTQVNIYVYPNGIKTKVAEVMTDAKGWITLPQVQLGVKYRLKVKD